MLAKRRSLLTEYIKENKTVSMEELCKIFSVSMSTMRRDIDELEELNIIKKVYGGVIFVEDDVSLPLNVREQIMTSEKDRIGRMSASLVKDKDVIMIDAGTTAVQIIKYLTEKKDITVITNSLLVAREAMEYNITNIILSGGNLLASTCSLNGPVAIDAIKNLNSKCAFISATGVSIEKGLSNSVLLESEVKRQMIKCSEKIILMVDHTKLGVVSLVTFCSLKDIDVIVTDSEPGNEFREYFKSNGIKLMVADK